MKEMLKRILQYQYPEPVYPFFDLLERTKSIICNRAHPLHRSEGYRPFFIVGSGRSGTTLLRRILMASSEMHIPPEIYCLGTVIEFFRRNRHMSWPYLVNTVLSYYGLSKHHNGFDFTLRPLAQELEQIPTESRSLALIINSIYHYHGKATQQTFTRWGDKAPNNSFNLYRISALFPDAQYIHSVRDGVDVVGSCLAFGRFDSLEATAARWRISVRTVENFIRRHKKASFRVRYEELVRNPLAVIPVLCEFLDVPFIESMIHDLTPAKQMGDVGKLAHLSNVRKPITTTSIGKGRRDMSHTEKTKLQKLIGRELKQMGYPPATEATCSEVYK